MMQSWQDVLLCALGAVNVLSFSLMGVDKRRAQQGRWRIPERTLFLAAGCFGALGGLLGMQVFRHKTRHASFRIGLPVMLALQLALLAGAWLLL